MWIYEKKLEFPVKITRPDGRLAKIMIEQYGGGDGEMGAVLRYLSQKFTMVTPQAKATLNDIATEELAHLEMMGTIVHQLTQGLTKDQIIASGLDPYYVNHGLGVYASSAAGVPFNAAVFQSKGDPITDLYEDMAADAAAAKEQHIFHRQYWVAFRRSLQFFFWYMYFCLRLWIDTTLDPPKGLNFPFPHKRAHCSIQEKEKDSLIF